MKSIILTFEVHIGGHHAAKTRQTIVKLSFLLRPRNKLRRF